MQSDNSKLTKLYIYFRKCLKIISNLEEIVDPYLYFIIPQLCKILTRINFEYDI